jgi:hypothetical protein
MKQRLSAVVRALTPPVTALAFSAARSLTPQDEADFFASLRLSNGTFKTTDDHRMDDLNEFVVARWRSTAFRPTEIMDIGVSSGISTGEWLEALLLAGFQPHMTGTDLALWGRIVFLRPGVSVLASGDSTLQYVIFGMPVRPWRRRLDYFTGSALISMLANNLIGRRMLGSGTPILLLSRRVSRRSEIEWLEDDIFSANPIGFIRRFDSIRAANVLNRGYFTDKQLEHAVVNLKERLAGPNARLIVNRTRKDGSNHATIFRLTDANRFEPDGRLGQGSEIEDIILAA